MAIAVVGPLLKVFGRNAIMGAFAAWEADMQDSVYFIQ
jgi:hypothetical protein